MKLATEHPLRDDPAAESDDAPNPDCPDCGRKMILCWSARVVCLTCNESNKRRFAVEDFNRAFGFDMADDGSGLHAMANYARMMGRAELADKLSAASKPLTAKPEAVPSAAAGNN